MRPQPVDLVRCPLAYPGPLHRWPALLLADGATDLYGPAPGRLGDWTVTDETGSSLDQTLAAHSAAPMSERVAVAAVGSNGCQDVLRRKLFGARPGLSPTDGPSHDQVGHAVPMTPATVAGLGIAHAAFVSRPGFIPAAPAEMSGETASVVLTWLDRDQLARLDATEPNYHRVRLVDGRSRTTCGRRVLGVDVYASRWHVLRDGPRPMRLTTQSDLFVRLGRRGLHPWRTWPPAVAATTLARDPGLRESLRHKLIAIDLVWPTGQLGAEHY